MATKRTAKVAKGAEAASTDAKSQPTPPIKEDEQKKRLRELIALVTDTAIAKGWEAHTASEDGKGYKYATVAVSRHASNSYQEITGIFEITCAERIRITHHKTSFYSWGLDDLQDALGNEIFRLPWIKKAEKADSKPNRDVSDVALIERLLRRFHRSVRQLKHRYNDRPAFLIEDEYDVQDFTAFHPARAL